MAGRDGAEQPRSAEGAAVVIPAVAPAVAPGAASAVAPAVAPAAAAALAPGAAPPGADVAAQALDPPADPSAGEVHLSSRAESAATARRMAVSVIRRWGLPQHCDTVELLVSELVGNAVRHTGARTFGLRMQRRRGWIRVEVRDPSRALPALLPVRALDISGRGLFLVDTLSDRWGVDLQPRGKTTWFELRVADR